MTRTEVKAHLQAELERLVRTRMQLQEEKAAAVAGFNLALKKVDEDMAATLAELDECGVQQKLPLGEDENGNEL